jgi:WD40 repeat protein
VETIPTSTIVLSASANRPPPEAPAIRPHGTSTWSSQSDREVVGTVQPAGADAILMYVPVTPCGVSVSRGWVLGDVHYFFSTRPLVSPDSSVVATPDQDFVTSVDHLPAGGSTRLAPCESVRAFDQRGRVAAVDGVLVCDERGQDSSGASRIVDLQTGDTLLDLKGSAIYAAAFGPPGDDGLPRLAVVEDRDSALVTLFDLGTGKATGSYAPDADFVTSLAVSPDGARLAMLMDSGRLVVLDTSRIAERDDQTDATVFDIVAHAAGSKAVAFSGSGMIATGSSADGLKVWSRGGELVATVPTHQDDDPTFAFAPGTDTLFYEDGQGIVRRFAIDTDDAARLARSVLTRGFTAQECARYFPQEPCPKFET